MMEPSAMRQLHTLRDVVRWGASRFNEAGLFFGHGTDNAIDEAVTLVLHALHLAHDMPEHFWAAALTDAEKEAIMALFTARVEQRLPLPYLTHEAWFAGLKFYVDERVLVPRSPLAELIGQGFAPWLEAENIGSVLDLCTGSGCIAIACALALPQAVVDASDVSRDALAVAAHNLADYDLGAQLRLLEGDLFAPCGDKRYDLIISNPPYVDAAEVAALPPEYLHEPMLGLASGEDGLDLTRRILAGAGAHLNPGGVLIVEVGASQAALSEAFPDIDFVWLDFARGGEGVFLLSAEQLQGASA